MADKMLPTHGDITPQGVQVAGTPDNYERGDANPRAVTGVMAIILGSTLVVMLAMYGMFVYLNKQMMASDKRLPAMYAENVPAPPEPRLLPMPKTDEFSEMNKGETNIITMKVPNVFPWDYRELEIAKQSAEINSYFVPTPEQQKQGMAMRIPIAEAMRRETNAGTPALMPWQDNYSAAMRESREKGQIRPKTFDLKPEWETQDERFTSDSSGGSLLSADDLSK